MCEESGVWPPEAAEGSPEAQPRSLFVHDPEETRCVVFARIRVRFYRALDYLSLFAFVIVVYGAAVVADYAFFEGLIHLLERIADASPFIALLLHYFKVGLALIAMGLGAVHAGHSAWLSGSSIASSRRKGETIDAIPIPFGHVARMWRGALAAWLALTLGAMLFALSPP